MPDSPFLVTAEGSRRDGVFLDARAVCSRHETRGHALTRSRRPHHSLMTSPLVSLPWASISHTPPTHGLLHFGEGGVLCVGSIYLYQRRPRGPESETTTKTAPRDTPGQGIFPRGNGHLAREETPGFSWRCAKNNSNTRHKKPPVFLPPKRESRFKWRSIGKRQKIVV